LACLLLVAYREYSHWLVYYWLHSENILIGLSAIGRIQRIFSLACLLLDHVVFNLHDIWLRVGFPLRVFSNNVATGEMCMELIRTGTLTLFRLCDALILFHFVSFI
jgi:hypothetical protein